jgi:hypothetical protein
MNKILNTYGNVRAVADDDSRTAEFVISTESVDRHGTSIMLNGWDLSNYQRNPIVAYQHQAINTDNPDNIIGTGEVRMEDGALVATVRFESGDINPLAEKIYRKVQNGTLRATSVGFLPIDGTWGIKTGGRTLMYFTSPAPSCWSSALSTYPAIPTRSKEILQHSSKLIQSRRTRLNQG